MPGYPLNHQYQTALQNPKSILDIALQNGKWEVNQLGLPKPYSGGFVCTYKRLQTNQTWAVRCFIREVLDANERYREIATHLKKINSRYFVPIDYVSEGVLVEGRKYPITKMEWIQGVTLDQYLYLNYKDSTKIKALADKFLALVNELNRLGIAHGDLQHGNIIVIGDEIKLIDYDGMYVPTLRGRKSHEKGHTNYQHPTRNADHYDATIDRFSSFVIYLGLRAIAEKPNLYKAYGEGEECVLLRSRDFDDPYQSKVLSEISQVGSLSTLVSIFRQCCLLPIQNILYLPEVLQSPIKIRETIAKPTVGSKSLYRGTYPVIDGSRTSGLRVAEGQMVEVIGKVINVYEGFAKNKLPYAGLNFGNYKAKDGYIRIWSEGMQNMRYANIDVKQHYEGKWISVKGIVGTYYSAPNLEVTTPLEIAILDENEAMWRLGRSNKQTILEEARKDSNQTPSKEYVAALRERFDKAVIKKPVITPNPEKPISNISTSTNNVPNPTVNVFPKPVPDWIKHNEKVVGLGNPLQPLHSNLSNTKPSVSKNPPLGSLNGPNSTSSPSGLKNLQGGQNLEKIPKSPIALPSTTGKPILPSQDTSLISQKTPTRGSIVKGSNWKADLQDNAPMIVLAILINIAVFAFCGLLSLQ